MVVLSGRWAPRVAFNWLTISLALAWLSGCATQAGNITLGAVSATVVGAQAPSHEMEVIYYLGVFDPQDQLPPTVYRVRVHGQASMISQAKFASGWVRSELIDSLSTGGSFESGKLVIDDPNSVAAAKLKMGRRLVMFGPEGFREAPRDHRLVVIMGSDPSGFFNAMDKSLGAVAEAQAASQNRGLVTKLFVALAQNKEESERLNDLANNAAGTFPKSP